MYEINIQVDNRYTNAYVYKTTNSLNQYLEFQVYESIDSTLDNVCFCVCFFISNKRKQGFQQLKTTGKDGIKSLLWAKKCLVDFIEYLKGNIHSHGYITVYWEESHRKKAYCWALKDLDFYLGRVKGKEVLLYKF